MVGTTKVESPQHPAVSLNSSDQIQHPIGGFAGIISTTFFGLKQGLKGYGIISASQ